MSRRSGLCCLGGASGFGIGTVLALAEVPALALWAELVCALALSSTLALALTFAAPSASPARADAAAHPATSPNTPTMIPAARRGRPTKPLMLLGYSTRGAHRRETRDNGCTAHPAMSDDSEKNPTEPRGRRQMPRPVPASL